VDLAKPLPTQAGEPFPARIRCRQASPLVRLLSPACRSDEAPSRHGSGIPPWPAARTSLPRATLVRWQQTEGGAGAGGVAWRAVERPRARRAPRSRAGLDAAPGGTWPLLPVAPGSGSPRRLLPSFLRSSSPRRLPCPPPAAPLKSPRIMDEYTKRRRASHRTTFRAGAVYACRRVSVSATARDLPRMRTRAALRGDDD